MNVRILGTRGVPASHGGFETFAEHLSLYLVGQGHEVTVYCQATKQHEIGEDTWRGVKRVHLYGSSTPSGTIQFDWRSACHASSRDGIVLTLGYNTALFSMLYFLRGRPSLMNMDGIEWTREKWSTLERFWLRCNEFLGTKLSTHLIADHPEIGKHLQRFVATEKISVIPYGAAPVTSADVSRLSDFNCRPYEYGLCIARPEPENSILEIVRTFSKTRRGYPLVVLGKFMTEDNAYHRKVREVASDEVFFPGAIYDTDIVNALRFYAKFYVHGHRVGGTNPSLVEALAAGSPVVAHNNRFNQWVAGPEAKYFKSEEDLDQTLIEIGLHPEELNSMRSASTRRHSEMFTFGKVHHDYENLLQHFYDKSMSGHPGRSSEVRAEADHTES